MTDTTETVQAVIAEIKGFTVYTFEDTEKASQVLDSLSEDSLLEGVFKPCGDYDALKTGYTPFKGEGDNFLLKSGGSTMFQITTQVKKPHGATVKKLCKAAEEDYKVTNSVEKLDKDTKALIKENVIKQLLPDTTPEEPKTTLVWIKDQYLIVGEGSYKKTEDLVSVVRDTTGTLPVKPLDVVEDVTENLTEMLNSRYDDTIALLDLVHLGKEGSKAVIKFEKDDLLGYELGSNGKKIYNVDVKQHLEEEFKVTKIKLTKDFEFDFTLNTNLEFTGCKVDKDVLAGSADLASMVITVDEVNKAVSEVVKTFGGLKEV